GIADYVRRLAPVLSARVPLAQVPFREALAAAAPGGVLADCAAVLVHYERSLVPSPEFLPALSARLKDRVYVVPHEVYRENPFAFPYTALSSAFPPLLWAKRLRYRWRHRDYVREEALQAAAYHAHRVLPASREGEAILRARARGPGLAERILPPVPLARLDLVVPLPDGPADRAAAATAGRRRIGIFGFLNPGLDYGSTFDLVAALTGVELVLVGGDRPGSGRTLRAGLEADISRRGLAGRVRITGYLAEADLGTALSDCDLFLGPMRFKSSSASLLQLFGLRRPILVPDLPLTRYLRDEGAPLDLYAGPGELRRLAEDFLAGRRAGAPDRYRWDFPRVAEAYLAAMGASASLSS
ncbi:MAG TPA: hypothetical protein VK465_13650, partial [Fibrobacteria bacterium]|nr:hypothetical protein [Fibrobacteria bacterium]